MTPRHDGGHAGPKIALAGAALLVAVIAAGPAGAASDREVNLEKRVARLESELREIKARLKKEISTPPASPRKPAPAHSSASANKIARSGRRGVSLTISGHVNRALLIANDGEGTKVFHVDNDHSSTRVRFLGVARFDEDFSVGTNIVVQIESNSTGTVNQLNDRAVGAGGFTERLLEVYLDSRRWGRLWLGQGQTASDDASLRDLSGTGGKVGTSGVGLLAGGLLFRRKDIPPGTGTPALSLASPSIAAAFDNLDGLSRADRIRYDTPRVLGLMASVSHHAGNQMAAALAYAAKFGPLKVAAGLGVSHVPDSFNQYNGSISVLHSSGLNLTFAAGARARHATLARGNEDFWYVKLGYLFNPFGIGKLALAVDYTENSDMLLGGDFGRAYGLFVVQHIYGAATDIYFGVRNYAYDQDGANFHDILAVLTGVRVKF